MMNFAGSMIAPARTVISQAAITTADLVAAVAAKSVKVYALRINVAGANVVSILDGATLLERFNFGAAGGSVYLDLRELPYYVTTAGAALRMTTTAVTQVDGVVESVTA